MTDESVHFPDDMQDLLDGRLDAAARERVEVHLNVCTDCRREWEILRMVRQRTRSLGGEGVPPDLAANLSAALDREDRRRTPVRPPARGGPLQRKPLLAYGAFALVVILALFVWIARPPSLPSAVARDYGRYRSGSLSLELQTDRTEAMERFFSARGISFPTRVFDLGMMKYRLIGGRVHRLARRQSAFFVYYGEGNKILICQMFQATLAELPTAAQRREHNGITFWIYHRQDQTQVFWQEGDVLCVLTSDIPAEEVISLAFAKAMNAQKPERVASCS